MTSDAETKFDEILAHFEVAKRRSTSAQARCPAHNDKNPSLTISLGERGIICKCHAGCRFEDIAMAAGLKPNDFFFDDKPLPKKERWQSYVEKKKGKQIEAVYHYKKLDGSYAFTRIRFVGKDFCYGILEKDYFRFGLGGKGRKSVTAVFAPSGLDASTLYYCEGEKDVLTLTKRGFCAFTCGGSEDWQTGAAAVTKSKALIILEHNDGPGKKLAKQVKKDCEDVAKSIKIVKPSDKENGDITDYFEEGHTKEEFAKLIENDLPNTVSDNEILFNVSDVKRLLDYHEIRDKRGNLMKKKILQTVKNHVTVLQNDSRYAGVLKYDSFSRTPHLVDTNTHELRSWRDDDDSAAFSILQSDYGLTNRADMKDATNICFRENAFNPLTDMLDTLAAQHDGNDYASTLVIDFLGAEDSPYTREVMRAWMNGAVVRAYKPGTKFDICPIIVGDQGIGKSIFCAMLALSDSWFCDSINSLDDIRAAEQLIGTWICELGELKALSKSGIEGTKAFLTATSDKIRLPYAKRSEVFPRSTVFIGTSNAQEFLTDSSGNRRFFPIYCGKQKPTKTLFCQDSMDFIKKSWGQIAAEYKEKGSLPLTLSEDVRGIAGSMQKSALVDDGFTGQVLSYVEDKEFVCTLQIWREGCGELSRPSRQKSSDVTNILLNTGEWMRGDNTRTFPGYGRQRFFRRKTPFDD